ncbi:MAG TPA: FeoB-associated Cys-rich membrane protein [Clostridiales bacterium]|nr:FeoB-associated Cys-rich membrane protein [Clostridiales bacterium]
MTATIIVITLLLLWAVLAVIYMVKRKKAGKNLTCSGDCSRCVGCSSNSKQSFNE